MKQAIEDFILYLRHELNTSPMTQKAYYEDLKAYAHYCSARLGEEDIKPSAGDLDLVRGWLSSQMDEGLKASSVGRRLSAVKGFYRYLLKRGKVERNPIASLRPPRGERPLPVYVPTDELESILAEIPDPKDWEGWRNHIIIAILYECGLRRSELATLQDRDVDTTRRHLKVRGKGNKERIVPFGQGLREKIEQWRQIRTETFGELETFLVTLRGKAMTGEAVYKVVHRTLQTVPNLSRRGVHALRHSFATDMLGAGADLMALKELMGHSRVSTTVGYTHTSFKQLKQMYNAHPRAKKEK